MYLMEEKRLHLGGAESLQRGRKQQKLKHRWMPCAEGQWARSLWGQDRLLRGKSFAGRSEGRVGGQNRKRKQCAPRLGDGRARQGGKTINYCISGASVSKGLDMREEGEGQWRQEPDLETLLCPAKGLRGQRLGDGEPLKGHDIMLHG